MQMANGAIMLSMSQITKKRKKDRERERERNKKIVIEITQKWRSLLFSLYFTYRK